MKFKLKELLKEKGYIRGPFGSSLKRKELKTEGIPVYEQQNVINNNRDFRYYIDNEKYEELKRFTVEENDLLITCSGTVGKVSIIEPLDKKGIISQALLILRVNTNFIIPKYLYYFFSSKKGFNCLVSRCMGSVQINIAKREVIENIELEIPSIEIQKKIVLILDKINRKIELNNQINNSLYEISKQLYKEWFIDYQFPNADGKSYKSSGGKMVSSEIGEIPEKWEVKRLDEISENYDSKRKPLSSRERERRKGNIPYYGATSIIDYVDDYLFDDIYVLMGEDGSVINSDNTPVLQYIWRKCWVNNHAHILKGKEITTEHLMECLRNTDVSHIITGAVQLKINQANMNTLKYPIPPQEINKKFEKMLDKIYSNIRNNIEESETLKQLRDTLVLKLMKGQINLENIEI